MGTQGVLLHYQTDHVRQDLRQYGNNIMREAVKELNLAQKVEVDGLNGFSRIKLFKYYKNFLLYLQKSYFFLTLKNYSTLIAQGWLHITGLTI